MAEKKGVRVPPALAIGLAATGLGVFSLFAGSGGPQSFIWLGAGLLLTCTGLIQRSIERSRD